MITTEHCVLRTAEPDDAPDMFRLYDTGKPRGCLLGSKREVIAPTVDELREILRPGEGRPQVFYAVEDRDGVIRGYGGLRTGGPEDNHYGELIVVMHEDDDLATPTALEAWEWLRHRAFRSLLWRKGVANILSCETAQREWLIERGFESCGVQREVVFTGGRWLDAETLVIFNRETYPDMGRDHDAQ